MSTIRQMGLVCCAAMTVGVGVWTNGFAFNNQEYIHLVNHRDHNGNLVVPQAKKPTVEKSSIVKENRYSGSTEKLYLSKYPMGHEHSTGEDE